MTILLLILSVCIIILLTAKLNVHPFLALLGAAFFFALLSGMSFDTIVKSVNGGFGATFGKIGLVIIFGVIMGTFLEQTGAAYKLSEVVLKIIGKKRVHEAMGLVGFVVSIPVFSDSGFIILCPLNKSLTKRAGLSLAGTAVALKLGLLISHILIPPTPGPIAAAGILEADVGLVMLAGLIIGIPTLIVAVIYARYVGSKTYIDPNSDVTEEEIEQKLKKAPNSFKSFLPILVPILLILVKSILEFQLTEEEMSAVWTSTIRFLGTPTIALLIGMLLAFTLPEKFDGEILSTTGWLGKSLGEASTILLITGAGGIFGSVLQNSGIADSLTGLISGANLGIWLPFILCAIIKTAHGSSTVALITTASIMAPLLSSLGFDSEIQKVLVVMAIGAGAAVVSHANDSGFWVVSQMSGFDTKTGYRVYTRGTFTIGVFAGLLVWIASLFV
jgi:GntP family gluconate:H+ symporter